MLMNVISFIVGCIIGGIAGITTMCLLFVASNEDDAMERWNKE